MSEEVKVNGMLDSASFLKTIDAIAQQSGVPYIDAVIDYCEKNGIEVETAAAIIKRSELVKGKIQDEAESLHMIPKSSPKLPI